MYSQFRALFCHHFVKSTITYGESNFNYKVTEKKHETLSKTDGMWLLKTDF